MDMQTILKLLGGSGGPPGTADDPWNPAAKLGHGIPSVAPGAAPKNAMEALMPQTMAAKGGSHGGG